MYTWEHIKESIEYIENHYDEVIGIEKLSSIANLSAFYYQRLFRKLVGKNVGEYVKLRKLSHAIVLFQDERKTLLDIALECGFSSHSSFTKSFVGVYGISPSEARKSGVKLDPFAKPDLELLYTNVEVGVPLITNQMVLTIDEHMLMEPLLYVGRTTKSPIEDIAEPKVNALAAMWHTLPSEIEKVKGDAEIGVGIDVLTPSEDPKMFNYFVGFESNKEIASFQSWTMPKGRYVVCTYEAENFDMLVGEALYKASKYLYESWLPKYNIDPEPLLVQKYYNPFQEDCYIELWAKVED